MKIKSLKKSLLIFSAVIILGYGIGLACADGWFYYDYDSDFTPEVFVDNSYSPLFFAPDETFYGNGFDTEYNVRFNKAIVAEWADYLGTTIPQAQLSFLLLNDSATTDIPDLYKAVKSKAKPPVPFQSLALSDPRVKGFIEFLFHAKTIEKSSAPRIYPWNYDEYKPTPVDVATIAAVEKLYNDTRDPFLKNRFWFQTMKAYFYSAKQQSTVAFFEKTKALQPVNALYYRGLSYVAGVHYRAKDYAKANYLYSIVFDKFPTLRQVSAYNFHPQEDADFEASLSLAADNKEKATLWALLGYYGDELAAIKEIYTLDPGNQHLAYLLTRAINKQEVKLNGQPFTSSAEYKQMARDNVNEDLLQQVSKMATAGNTARPELWSAAAGYLNSFAGKYQLAAQYLDKAEAQAQTDGEPDVRRQIRLLKIINTVGSLAVIDGAAEKKLLAELEWMHAHCGSAGQSFRCSHVINWSNRLISYLYKEKNNLVMSELFDHQAAYYRNQANLEAMKAFMQSPTRSDWQKFALKNYSISLSNIFEYQAVMNGFAGNLDAAIGFMEKTGARDIHLPGNPFNGKIKDCHDCDHAAPQKVTYSKLTFLQKMKEMQTNVDNGNDIYNNSLLLANAYYNMTYYGNARAFYSGNIMDQPGNDIDPFYIPQLLNCDRARHYYQQAFEAAATDEQKAKCVYMMAKCDRNDYYTNTIYLAKDQFDEYFVSWENFRKLKEYSGTKYYQEVIKECGYFESYLKGN